MTDKCKQIIEHYGLNHQKKKFIEETAELFEAITEYETFYINQYEIPMSFLADVEEHILEELADCCVLLIQIKEYFNFKGKDIKAIMENKIKRQLERMENKDGK